MKILIYNEIPAEAEHAARFTAALTRGVQPEIMLIGVSEDHRLDGSVMDLLGNTQKVLGGLGLKADVLLKHGNAIPEIVRHVKKAPYDLIVVGAERKGHLLRKAYRIIRAVAPPVLVTVPGPETCSRIVVCTSGRDGFEDAIRLIGGLARGAGASVLLMHVFVEVPAMHADLLRRKENQEWLLHSGSSLARNLRTQAEILVTQGVPCELRLKHGCVTDEILNEVRREGQDLLVLGTNPSGSPLSSYIIGDVTREVINDARIPTLVVRVAGDEPGLRARMRRFLSAFLNPESSK